MGPALPPEPNEPASSVRPGVVVAAVLIVVAVIALVVLLRPDGGAPEGSGSPAPTATRTQSAEAGSVAPTAPESPTASPASPQPSAASADGAIAFEHASDVWVMRPDGSGARSLVTGAYGVAWSPDGARLLVVLQDPATAAESIAMVEAGGGEPVVLGRGSQGAWSPDGEMVAVSDPFEGQEIRLLPVDGGADQGTIEGSLPDWSPDGSRIAFLRAEPPDQPCEAEFCEPAPCALWLFDVASASEEPVTSAEYSCEHHGPQWSPRGDAIALGNRVLAPDGSVLLAADQGESFAQRPWSPNGEALAVLVEDEAMNHRTLEVISFTTGERATVVPPGEALLMHPGWSPDGTALVYAAVVVDASGNGTPRIHVVPTDGGEPVAIGPDDAQFPLWQPLPAD